MKTATKLRGIFWAFLSLVVIGFVGVTSYTTQASNIDGTKVFEGKTEEQIGLEFLEIYSYKYEEQPIISEQRDDYSFSVYRADRTSDTIDSELYVTFKDLTIGEDGLPSLGLIDVMVYCNTGTSTYGDLIGFQRLGAIAGTDVYAHFLELPTDKIDACSSNDFTFYVDTTRTQTLYELDVLEQISLSDLYDVQTVTTGAQLNQVADLNDGFSGDITKSSYNIYSWQKAITNAVIAAVVVLPIGYGLWFATERELFGNNIITRRKKK